MTQEERDNILMNLAKNQEKLCEGQEKLKTQICGLEEGQENLEGEVLGLKDYLALKEVELYDKIKALFDAREVSLDKFKENDRNLKSIRDILEQHSFRLSILESKVN